MKVMVSACLMGRNCKYNGGNNFSEPLAEFLKDKDVVFLYFAYSSDEVSWKNVIKENNITGDNVYHYNLPMEQQLLLNELWNVTAYPTYILYDREGRLVTTDAQSPSSREGLLLQINSLLKK